MYNHHKPATIIIIGIDNKTILEFSRSIDNIIYIYSMYAYVSIKFAFYTKKELFYKSIEISMFSLSLNIKPYFIKFR